MCKTCVERSIVLSHLTCIYGLLRKYGTPKFDTTHRHFCPFSWPCIGAFPHVQTPIYTLVYIHPQLYFKHQYIPIKFPLYPLCLIIKSICLKRTSMPGNSWAKRRSCCRQLWKPRPTDPLDPRGETDRGRMGIDHGNDMVLKNGNEMNGISWWLVLVMYDLVILHAENSPIARSFCWGNHGFSDIYLNKPWGFMGLGYTTKKYHGGRPQADFWLTSTAKQTQLLWLVSGDWNIGLVWGNDG